MDFVIKPYEVKQNTHFIKQIIPRKSREEKWTLYTQAKYFDAAGIWAGEAQI